MIQAARSASSRSFLREAQDCVLIMEEQGDVDYFQKLINQVIANRKDENIIYTGATSTREQLLAYLHSFGDVNTANVWCRLLMVTLENVNELKSIIASRLAAENIYGVLEIHLQDREINSPHLQFVGIRALEAERIIAEAVVELGYESSLESAMSKKAEPYYLEDPNAHTNSLERTLERQKERESKKQQIREIEESITPLSEQLQERRDRFYEILNQTDTQIDERRNRFYEILNESLDNSKNNIKTIDFSKYKRQMSGQEESAKSLADDLQERINKIKRRMR